MSKHEIARLADGTRTAREIAAILGVTSRYVCKTATTLGLVVPTGEIKRKQSSIDYGLMREMAAAGKTTDEIGAAFGLTSRTISNAARTAGIKIKRRPPPNPRARKPIIRSDPRAAVVATVDEWIAIHGAPRRFEAGRLDQLLADTFASVGKALTYSAGKGTSWTPYRLGNRNLNRGQVIAEANKIRAKQGKPLFSEPSRKAPVAETVTGRVAA